MPDIVKDGDKIKVEYTGTFDNGEVFDSTDMHEGEPLEFEVGAHQVVPGFENAVLGKELNVEFKIRLEPEDAYGEKDPERVTKVPKEQLPPDMDVQIGMILGLAQQHGDHVHQIPAEVIEIGESEITLDLNHPMAGKTLNFAMKVIEIN